MEPTVVFVSGWNGPSSLPLVPEKYVIVVLAIAAPAKASATVAVRHHVPVSPECCGQSGPPEVRARHRVCPETTATVADAKGRCKVVITYERPGGSENPSAPGIRQMDDRMSKPAQRRGMTSPRRSSQVTDAADGASAGST